MSLPLLLEPDVFSSLPDSDRERVLLVDVCQTQTYARMHIPGAVHVPPPQLVCGIPPAAGKLPDVESLTRLFAGIGYSPDRSVVVYDDEGGGWAGRFLWTLDVIGHKSSSVLNGGLHSWAKEGFPLSNEPASPEPTPVSLSIDRSPMVDVSDILEDLEKSCSIIWDARGRDEYEGLKMTARRNGHIPGAVNLDWLELMDHDRNLRLLPEEILRQKLASVGINGDRPVITHCHSHHRSGLSYLASRILGIPVRAYDGSWSEWGNLPDVPVEGPGA